LPGVQEDALVEGGVHVGDKWILPFVERLIRLTGSTVHTKIVASLLTQC